MEENEKNPVKPGYELFLNHTASPQARANFFYIQYVGHHFFDKDRLYCDRKNFKSMVALYTLDGKGYLYYKDKNYEIIKGRAMVINCMEHHIMRSDPTLGWHYKWVHFYGPNAKRYVEMIHDKFGPVIELENSSAVTQRIDRLIRMVQKNDLDIEIKASNDITEILTDIYLNESPPILADGKDIRDIRVKNVLDYIYNNYSSKITCSDMLKLAYCSKAQLYRIFKAMTGYQPHEFLIRVRINSSKNLLLNTTMSVDAIALQVGFENTSNYIGTFKKLEGITPSVFRKIRII